MHGYGIRLWNPFHNPLECVPLFVFVFEKDHVKASQLLYGGEGVERTYLSW